MDATSLGRDRTNRAAKYAAPNGPPYLLSTQFANLPLSLTDMINLQADAPQSEKDSSIQMGAKQSLDGLYIYQAKWTSYSPPPTFCLTLWLVLFFHQMGHMGW